MTKFSISLDDNEVRSDEPLGTVVITSNGHAMTFKTVFLDALFSTLVQTYLEAQKRRAARFEIEGEGDPIELKHIIEGWQLLYGKQSIIFRDISEFGSALTLALENLVTMLPDIIKNRIFQPALAMLQV